MTEQGPQLRRGWTTGTCATAAAKAAYAALLTGTFPDPVEVTLPQGAASQFRAGGHPPGYEAPRPPASSRMPATTPT